MRTLSSTLLIILQSLCFTGFSQDFSDSTSGKFRLKITYINGKRTKVEHLEAASKFDYDSLVFYVRDERIDSSICFSTNFYSRQKEVDRTFLDKRGRKHIITTYNGYKTYERIPYGYCKSNYTDYWYKNGKVFRTELNKGNFKTTTTWDEKGNEIVEKIKRTGKNVGGTKVIGSGNVKDN